MKRIVLIFVAVVMLSGFNSYAQKGSVTPKILQQIQESFKNDEATKAATNAVSNNDIKKLALNRDNYGKVDHHFKYKVNVKGITDQKSSGRCWMFTGLNVMRPKAMDHLNISDFEFSTNYLYFWDQFEKSNLFLEAIITTRDAQQDDRTVEWLFKNAIGDGGVWNLFADVVGKYGLVPKDVMPETYNSEKTSTMQKLIKRKLREDGIRLRKMTEDGASYDFLEKKKIEMLGDIYRMLVVSLGEPPVEFSWRYKDKDGNITPEKEYTPKSFYNEVVGVDMNEYVLFMDDPTRPYYQLFEIEYDRNMHEGRNWKFINIPALEIKVFAKESLKNNEAMYFSCDVGKQLNSDYGTLDLNNYDYEALFGVEFGMNKKERVQTFDSGSSHGMALVGVDVDEKEEITKWLLENSWGSKSGHNGYLAMTDDWFDQYMFRVVINKKFVDEKTLKILKQKAKKLPPWDPMFQMDK